MCSDIWAVLLDMFRRIKQDKSTTWRFQRPHKQANHLGRVAYFKRFLFFLHSPGPGPSEVQSKDLYQAYWKRHISFQQSRHSGPFVQCLECLPLLRGVFIFSAHCSINTKVWETKKWKKRPILAFTFLGQNRLNIYNQLLVEKEELPCFQRDLT